MPRTDAVVLDASVAIAVATTDIGFDIFGGAALHGPPLLSSEFRSTLHATLWRRGVDQQTADDALRAMFSGRIKFVDHPSLGDEAWRLADWLGWARTYDAEYLALASLLDGRLVTRDLRLRRGADRTGLVVTLQEFLGRA